MQARQHGRPGRGHVGFDVSFHALLADADPLRREEELEVGARGVEHNGAGVVEHEQLPQPRERERGGLLLEHGFQARDELRHQAAPALALAVLVAEHEVEGDAVAQHAPEVAHPEAYARVHLSALRHPPRVVVRRDERPEVARAASGRGDQVRERGLGGDQDGVGGAPAEEPGEERVRLPHRDVHIQRGEQLRRGALERGHGSDQVQHRAGAGYGKLTQSGYLLGRELRLPEAEHALHGAQRLRPRLDPSRDFPSWQALARRANHPGDVKSGEPASARAAAAVVAGEANEGRTRSMRCWHLMSSSSSRCAQGDDTETGWVSSWTEEERSGEAWRGASRRSWQSSSALLESSLSEWTDEAGLLPPPLLLS
ncbi:hypothetical protein EJB05_45945, partial [Eragrostis curvula]